jgi:hypothetical protein
VLLFEKGGDKNMTVEGQVERELPPNAGKMRRRLVKEALLTFKDGESVSHNELRY